jgi:hypothetical protein
MNIFTRFLLRLLRPEALDKLFSILISSVAMYMAKNSRNKYEAFAIISVAAIFFLGSYLLHDHYKTWFETVTSEAHPNPPIGAPQAEVDLEAQPVNFPPMPDTLDIYFNPWSLP